MNDCRNLIKEKKQLFIDNIKSVESKPPYYDDVYKYLEENQKVILASDDNYEVKKMNDDEMKECIEELSYKMADYIDDFLYMSNEIEKDLNVLEAFKPLTHTCKLEVINILRQVTSLYKYMSIYEDYFFVRIHEIMQGLQPLTCKLKDNK